MDRVIMHAIIVSIMAYIAIISGAKAAEVELIELNSKEILLLDKSGLYINGWTVNGLIKVKKLEDDTIYGADYKLAIADIRADCIKQKLEFQSISYFDDENALKNIPDKGRSDLQADFDGNRRLLLIRRLCSELR